MKIIFKRLFCMILILSTAFCTPLSALAAEDVSSIDNVFVPVEDSVISVQEALDILNMTESELDGRQIMVGDFDISLLESVNPGTPYDSGYFSFSGTNIGAYRTLNGDNMAYTILWKPTEQLSNGCPALEVNLYAYGSSTSLNRWYVNTSLTNPTIIDGYYKSPNYSLPIHNGLDYHFIYNSFHDFYNGIERKDSRCSVRLIMVVV